MHYDLMYDLFRIRRHFENTEFTFNNNIASCVKKMGYTGVYTEGVDRILNWRSPHHIYSCESMPVLLRDTQVSDDIASRFRVRGWDKFPLTADTYAEWISGTSGDLVNVFIDYETFGEHFWKRDRDPNFLSFLPESWKSGVYGPCPAY